MRSGLVDLATENDPRARPVPLIIYTTEKREVPKGRPEYGDESSEGGSSTEGTLRGLEGHLTPAAQIELARMAEQVRVLRSQMHKMKMEKESRLRVVGTLDDDPLPLYRLYGTH
jgi:hypothetical protein